VDASYDIAGVNSAQTVRVSNDSTHLLCRIQAKIFGAYYADLALAEELNVFVLVSHDGKTPSVEVSRNVG
jgi:hypothetical protein